MTRTVAEIDRELASRTAEVAELSTTLMELDSHPGRQHVRSYTPTGCTAQRWTTVESTLGQLWDDLASLTSTLESARSLRGHRDTVDDNKRRELMRLLAHNDGPVRLRAALPGVLEFFAAVDGINTMVAKGLAPSLKLLDAVGAAVPADVVDLLAVSATDPLSLSADEVERQCADIAEVVALQLNWADAVAATAAMIDTVRAAAQQAADARSRAGETVVAGPFPLHTDDEDELRTELASMTEPDVSALRELRRRIDSALQRVRHDEELATGLLDRRAELTGRLRVYQAKAARLGLAEDPELVSSGLIAAGLLSRRPCDLRAVTRAVADYQQMVTQKQGSVR